MRLIKVALGFIIATLVCYNFVGKVLPWVVKPAGKLVFTSPLDGFSAYMTLAGVMGFIVSLPWTVYHVWAFIAGALKPEEKKAVYIFRNYLFFVWVYKIQAKCGEKTSVH